MATKPAPIQSNLIGGVYYSQHFLAAINLSAARVVGLNLSRLQSPYDLWNSILCQAHYHLESIPKSELGTLEQRAAELHKKCPSGKWEVYLLGCGN